MVRLFQTHKVRKQVELDGLWDFTPMKQGDELPKEYHYRLPVPGCWEMHPDFLSYRGKGAYRKTIHVSQKTALQLVFKGVSHTGDVYLDGKHIAHHYNAFTPFYAVIPEVEAGEHEIVVMVDNSFSEKSALHIPNDYYTYGGITRPAAFEEISDIFIERIQFTPIMDGGSWKAQIDIFVKNVSSTEKEVELKGTLGSHSLDFGNVQVAAGADNKVSKTFLFADVKPWSHQDPQLYSLETLLYIKGEQEPVDDYIERVGFRIVKVEGRKLLVNGEEVFVQGFNRHEDHPFGGCAIPFELMVKDMDIMQDLGVNALRTCHYPNDERFLDLCDERGIMVWEENHARGLGLERMQNPNFEKQCEDCNREMVQNHYNHPSIIIWGILNECASHTEDGRRMYKAQFEQIRAMDSSRPLTFATCQHFTDICLDLVDIVSINIYHRWYQDEDALEAYEKELEWIESTEGKGKPIIVSEFGGGAIYGYREPSRPKWSEERQCDIMEDTLSVYLNRDEIIGTFIWQFCDCRVTEEEWALKRPRTKNNKGIVDEYRRPKLAYSTVQKYYKGNKKAR